MLSPSTILALEIYQKLGVEKNLGSKRMCLVVVFWGDDLNEILESIHFESLKMMYQFLGFFFFITKKRTKHERTKIKLGTHQKTLEKNSASIQLFAAIKVAKPQLPQCRSHPRDASSRRSWGGETRWFSVEKKTAG